MTDTPFPGPPVVVRLAECTQADQAEILGDDADPFGVADAGPAWLPKDVHFGIGHEGRLVAHAGLLQLPLSVGGIRVRVVGVGGAAVAAGLRERGRGGDRGWRGRWWRPSWSMPGPWAAACAPLLPGAPCPAPPTARPASP